MFNKPLITLSTGRAREALLKAIDDDEGVSELEPLLFLLYDSDKKLKTQRGAAVGGDACLGNISISLAERAHAYLGKQFDYLLDIVECTPNQLQKKCLGIGKDTIHDIMWALKNFDRHEEGKKKFLKTMKPGPMPEKKFRNNHNIGAKIGSI